MQIEQYIQELLYRYECIIIPGFGALLSHKEPSSINQDNLFVPPRKVIFFNRQLQANDGLLANYIATSEQCHYEIALQKLRNIASQWTQQLFENKQLTLKGIGVFSLSNEQKITFEPQQQQNYLSSSFGLVPIQVEKIIREKTIAKVPIENPSKPPKTIPILRYAAVGLIAITLGGLTGLKIYNNQIEDYNFAEKQKADTSLQKQIQEATFVINNPLPVLTLTVPKKTGNYHIVAGAFKQEGNAFKKVDLLKQKGYPARLIGTNKYGLHQVVYNSFSNKEEALKFLFDIKKQENIDAWLLVENLD